MPYVGKFSSSTVIALYIRMTNYNIGVCVLRLLLFSTRIICAPVDSEKSVDDAISRDKGDEFGEHARAPSKYFTNSMSIVTPLFLSHEKCVNI